MADVPAIPEDVDQKALVIPKTVEESDGGMMTRWAESAIAVATNLDTETPEGRAMSTRCLAQADVKTRAAVGQTIEAVAFLAHVVEIVDPATGQIDKKIRVVLVLADGRTLSTTSKACVRTISLIHQNTKGKKWDPPILIEVREFPLEGGRSYCDMREVVRADPKKTKKG